MILWLLYIHTNMFTYQSGTLCQSSNNYPDHDIATWSSNFYFSFEGDSYRFSKSNLFIFILAREFSSLHFTFTLLKIFTKFQVFLHRGWGGVGGGGWGERIFQTGKGKIFRFLMKKILSFLRNSSVKPPLWHLSSIMAVQIAWIWKWNQNTWQKVTLKTEFKLRKAEISCFLVILTEI